MGARSLVAAALLVFAACGDTQSSCESRGGEWMCGCQPGCCGQVCNEPAADAGKRCTSGSDCTSFSCLAPEGTAEGDTGLTGACCELESCFGRLQLQDGTVEVGPVP